MILILTKGYVYGPTVKHFIATASHLSVGYLTVSSSGKQKRKGLRGSVDLEKIKCVETVQPEANSAQERMYAFQVEMSVNVLLSQKGTQSDTVV